MKRYKRYKYQTQENGKRKSLIGILSFFVCMVFLLTSCTDKDLEGPNGQPGTSGFEDAEMVLRFRVSLEDMTSSTRAAGSPVDKIDNYVDTQNMFQVLVFDQEGNFLFESVDRIVTPTPDNNGQWDVLIPLRKTMKDRLENEFSLNPLKIQLEKESFKIAVLANWQNKSRKYTLNWGWNESKLNPSVSSPKNINDLHHLDQDDNYNNDVYSYLMKEDGKKKLIGLKTDWVTSTMNFSKREGAEGWIRKNWNPNTGSTSLLDYYKTTNESGKLDIWQLWNFGGYYETELKKEGRYEKNKDLKYSDLNAEKFESAWQDRNAQDFYNWIGTIHQANLTNNVTSYTIDGLTYVAVSPYATGDNPIRIDAFAYHDNDRHGIILPPTNETNPDKKNGNNPYIKTSSQYACGYLKFKAPGTGILRINWSSAEEGKNAKIVIQRNSNNEGNPSNVSTTSINKDERKLSINQDPEEIVIFNRADSKASAVIYSIEYICDKYLFDTDRIGVLPTTEQPIPMYGVQSFNKIDNWGVQEVLDLSDGGAGKRISLVRALAKVEIYFPDISDNQPLIFMRSMNRSARCEPMDVSTPTWDSWTKHTEVSRHDKTHCEWFDIQKYGPGYNYSHPNGVDKSTDLADYKSWYSYFYGSWSKDRNSSGSYSDRTNGWKWDFGVTIPSLSTDVSEYPHIFNPDIERSDFCKFVDMGKDNSSGMHRYVLYVPDKFIDDPNDAGDLTSTPKIAHIEYRYPRMTNYLDDNSCFRIYFTDYSENTDIAELYPDQFDNFEKNLKETGYDEDGNLTTEYHDYLKDLWPIMRNHIYRFYINSSNETQDIRVTVNDWGQHPDPKQEDW